MEDMLDSVPQVSNDCCLTPGHRTPLFSRKAPQTIRSLAAYTLHAHRAPHARLYTYTRRSAAYARGRQPFARGYSLRAFAKCWPAAPPRHCARNLARRACPSRAPPLQITLNYNARVYSAHSAAEGANARGMSVFFPESEVEVERRWE